MAGAWSPSTPATFNAGEIVLATKLNAEIRDRMLWLGGTDGKVTQIVSASFGGAISTVSTTSVSTGDNLNMTTGGGFVVVFYSASFSNTTLATVNTFGISVDAGAPTADQAFQQAVAGYPTPLTIILPLGVISSTAHNFSAYWKTTAGTINQGPVIRNLTVLEIRR